MSKPWQLQDAKNRFSEVVDRAIKDGPQVVTRRGTKSAVVVSFETFTRLTRRQNQMSLVSFLRQPAFRPLATLMRREPATDRDLYL